MRNRLLKISKGIILSFLGFVSSIYAKAVHAMVVYAPPEVFERQTRPNILLGFIREYTVLVIFVSLLAIVGFISIVRVFFLKLLKKEKQDPIIQPQKPTGELPNQ